MKYVHFNKVLNFLISCASARASTSLLSNLDFKKRTLLCSGYLASTAAMSAAILTSFSATGLASGKTDLKRVGIFLITASSVANFPTGKSSIFEAFPYKPCS